MDLDDRIRAEFGRGDADAAATLALESLGPGVLGFLSSILPPEDARDAFSFFAEDLWRGLPDFRWECTLRGWAYRLAWHASARQRRDAFHRRVEPLRDSLASQLAASITTRSASLPGSRRDRLAQLRQLLDLEEQTLLVLRIDRELEWEEVAAVFAEEGKEVSTVALRKRFERLKERLAEMARERGMLD